MNPTGLPISRSSRLKFRLSTGLGAIAGPIVATLAAIALNVADHKNIYVLVSLVIVAIVTGPIFLLINRQSGSDTFDEEVYRDAVQRIRLVYRYLLDFYGTAKLEIRPPGAVSASPDEGQQFDLGQFFDQAEFLGGELFIARLAESGRRSTLVLGEHGSGKSTLLLRLAIRMADDFLQNKSRDVPIILGLRDWTDAYPLRRWVVDQAVATYALRPEIVNGWVDRERIIVLLDGLDEVVESRRKPLLDALNVWAHSAQGTRIVVSCRTSTSDVAQIVMSVHADQLAIVRPLPENEVRRYAQAALSGIVPWSSAIQPARLTDLRRLLEEQIAAHEDLRRPVMLDLLASITTNYPQPKTPRAAAPGSAEDPAEPALSLGTDLLKRGDYEAAKGAYLAASRLSGSRLQALSTTMYAACEALLGNADAARTAVQESVATRLKESVAPVDPHMRSRSLSADEKRVLRVMSYGISYDLSQISSMASLTPSRADAALLALKVMGAIESTKDKDDGIRYRVGDAFLVDA